MSLSGFQIEPPSGDLAKDLGQQRRVLLRRGEQCSQVRAVGEDGSRSIEFVASTDGVKRDGNRVRIGDVAVDGFGFDFSNFAKNPAMLWAHSYEQPPVGSWTSWRIDHSGGARSLVATASFATHEFAETIYQLYLAGHMRAVSIGWTPITYEPLRDKSGSQVGWDFLESELLEISAVPIPADPDALATAVQRGLIGAESLERFLRVSQLGDISRGHAYVLDHRERDAEPEAMVGDDDVMATEPMAMPDEEETPLEAKGLDAEDLLRAVQTLADLAQQHAALGVAIETLAERLDVDAGGDLLAGLADLESETQAFHALVASLTAVVSHGDAPATDYDEPEEGDAFEAMLAGWVEGRDEGRDEGRVGKKVSAERAGRLGEARDALRSALEILSSVLGEDEHDDQAEGRIAAIGRSRRYVAALLGNL